MRLRAVLLFSVTILAVGQTLPAWAELGRNHALAKLLGISGTLGLLSTVKCIQAR